MALAYSPLNGSFDPYIAPRHLASPQRTIIQNVRVWDGERLIPNTSIVIEGSNISPTGDTTGAQIYDGKGGFLMPGMIDSHVHLSSKFGLSMLAKCGVTTAFDMGSYPTSKMAQWRDVGDQGLASLRYSGAAAVGRTQGFPAFFKNFPIGSSFVYSDESATNFVDTRVNEGVDHLKMFTDQRELPEQTYQQRVRELGERHQRWLVTHAADYTAQRMARAVGGKFITHVPKDIQALTHDDVAEMIQKGQIAIPTLLIMKIVTRIGTLIKRPYNYSYANDSVARMYEMGVPILAGTDSIGYPPLSFGSSLHSELQLLTEAGMTTEDVLKAATSSPAQHFALSDRGILRPGMRADLLLLKADPRESITNSKRIQAVWTAGTRVHWWLPCHWSAWLAGVDIRRTLRRIVSGAL